MTPATSRAIALSLAACGALLGACDVRVTDVSKSEAKLEAGECIASRSTTDDLVYAITKAVEGKDYKCVEEAFLSAKAKSAESRIVDAGRRTLTLSDIPDSTAVAALSYLMYATRGGALDLIDQNLERVKAVALGGSEQMGPIAIALLSTRRSDDDLDVFAASIDSGDEAALAYSIFALADNCSPRAKSMLQEKLRSSSVQSYLKKYAAKESITTTVKGTCPDALG